MNKSSILVRQQASSFDVEIIQSPYQTITVEVGTVDDKGKFKSQKSYTESFDFPTELNCTHLKGSVSPGGREYITGEVLCNDVQNSTAQEFITGNVYVYTATSATRAKEVTIKYSAPGASSIEYTELKGYANGRDTLITIAKESGYRDGTPELTYPGNTIYSYGVWKDKISGADIDYKALADKNMDLIPYTTIAEDIASTEAKATISISAISTWQFKKERNDGNFLYVGYTFKPSIKTNVSFLNTLRYNSTNHAIETINFHFTFGFEYVYLDAIYFYLPIDEFDALLKYCYYKSCLIINPIGSVFNADGSNAVCGNKSQYGPKFNINTHATNFSSIFRSFDSPDMYHTEYPSPIFEKLSSSKPTTEEKIAAGQRLINKIKNMVSNGSIIDLLPSKDLNNFAEFKLRRS